MSDFRVILGLRQRWNQASATNGIRPSPTDGIRFCERLSSTEKKVFFDYNGSKPIQIKQPLQLNLYLGEGLVSKKKKKKKGS